MNGQQEKTISRASLEEMRDIAEEVQSHLNVVATLTRVLEDQVRRHLWERSFADQSGRVAVLDIESLLGISGDYLEQLTRKQESLLDLLFFKTEEA